MPPGTLVTSLRGVPAVVPASSDLSRVVWNDSRPILAGGGGDEVGWGRGRPKRHESTFSVDLRTPRKRAWVCLGRVRVRSDRTCAGGKTQCGRGMTCFVGAVAVGLRQQVLGCCVLKVELRTRWCASQDCYEFHLKLTDQREGDVHGTHSPVPASGRRPSVPSAPLRTHRLGVAQLVPVLTRSFCAGEEAMWATWAPTPRGC